MLDDQPYRIGFLDIIFPAVGVANAVKTALDVWVNRDWEGWRPHNVRRTLLFGHLRDHGLDRGHAKAVGHTTPTMLHARADAVIG